VEGAAKPREACRACGAQNPDDARFCAFCGDRIAADPAPPPEGGDVADPLVGRLIADRYRIVSLIGRGGMGVVYKVEHVHIGKLMAMKLLHGELAYDRDVVKRFKREAEAASRLSHSNSVQIFDFGRSQGLMYLVMEYIAGHDLGWIVKSEGSLEFVRVARICAQVCGSVAEAHEKGVIHRDLKPENIMVTTVRSERDYVKVLDFGLAKLREHEGGNTLTRAGALVGTPYYMAPEHIRGEGMDHRLDIYALGAVMYKALTGVPPFWAPTPMGVLTKHLTEEAVAPSTRMGNAEGVRGAVDEIVMRAMAKNPDDRFGSMDELRDALVSYLTSVGESVSSNMVGISGPSTTGKVKTQARTADVVATRGDVDKFERRLRRKSRMGYVFWFLVLAGIGAGASWAYGDRSFRIDDGREKEPNNLISEATKLRAGAKMTGMLGKRIDRARGDMDIYALENPAGDRRFVRFDVTAVPNIDIAVDLVRAGAETPVLTANSGGVGGAEEVPNFPLRGTSHFLRVREVERLDHLPTENVSDAYEISWQFVEPEADHEREINNNIELAESIHVGDTRRGYLGWRGDVDTFCVDSEETAREAELIVDGIPGVDISLRLFDRHQPGGYRDINDGGADASERTGRLASPQLSRSCIEIAVGRSSGKAADATTMYTLRAVAPVGPEAGVP
jgi:serine/threonine-protein kinase